MRDPAEPLVGKTIAGRYRVTDRIAAGGMGTVYAATQEPLGRTVALKVLKPSFATDDVAVARFKKEAAVISALNHPNIVTLHDFGETDDGLLYIIMEFLRGRTLGALLRTEGQLPWRRTVDIVTELVRALGAAHAVGIIHRDLKLENVMLVENDDGRDYPKILDFGVAKTVNADDAGAPLTATDSSPGTPGYMSPELARGVTDDPRSDFYALGVVWFELLTGKRPFTARNAMDVFLHQMTQPTPSVRERMPDGDIPVPLDTLLQRLLDKDPRGRPADTSALLAALVALEEELDTAPNNLRVRVSLPMRGPRSDARGAAIDDVHTSPTGSPQFLPTQVGGPPMFTDPSGVFPPTEAAAIAAEPEQRPTEAAPTLTGVATLPVAPRAALDAPPTHSARRPTPIAVAASVAIGAALVIVTVISMRGTDAEGSAEHGAEPGDVHGAPVFRIATQHGVARRPGPLDLQNPKALSAPRPAAPTTAPSVSATVVAVPPAPVTSPVTATAGTAATAATTATTATSATPPDANVTRSRYEAVSGQMRDRMLLADDVPDYRRLSDVVREQLDAGHAESAAAALQELETALASVHLTDAFIAKKIARIEGSLPAAAPRDPTQAAQLAKLRGDVHERFGAHDLPGTNLALNRLWLLAVKLRMSAQAHQ